MNAPSFILPIAAFIGLTLSAHAEESVLTDAQKSLLLYKQGLAAEEAGNAQAALSSYKEAVQLNSRNANARYRLGVIKENYQAIAAKGRKAALDAIMIPEYQLSEASFSDALSALQYHVDKQTDGAVVPNFIVQDPKNRLASTKLTLTLRNVPAGTVLKYLLEMSGGRARFDKHAVVIAVR